MTPQALTFIGYFLCQLILFLFFLLFFKSAIDICSIPPEKRTLEDIHTLIKATASMQYFQDINRKNVNKIAKIHERICAVLQYESKKKGEIVFNIDEKSNKFFIILSGSVNILVPKNYDNIMKEKQENPKSKKNWFLFQKFKGGDSLEKDKNEEEEEEKDQFWTTADEKNTIKARIEEIHNKYAVLLGDISINDIKSEYFENLFDEGVLKFNFSNTLKEGQTFGELGLLTGKLRSATIICKEDCHFGIMLEEDFKNIVSVIELKKINVKFDFFKKYLIRNVSSDILRKFTYSFKKIKYSRMEYVYKEGDVCKEIYLIKKGEIQIQKCFTDNLRQLNIENKKLPMKPYLSKKKKIVREIIFIYIEKLLYTETILPNG